MAFIVDSAERAERLRQEGARVVVLTGSEISQDGRPSHGNPTPWRRVCDHSRS
jgi:hypothetical protein